MKNDDFQKLVSSIKQAGEIKCREKQATRTFVKAKLAAIDSFEQYEQFKANTDEIIELAQTIIDAHSFPQGNLALFSEGTNLVFSYNRQHVIKIYPPCHREQFTNELLVLQHIAGKLSIKTPLIQYQGEIEGWPYLIMSQLEGESLETLWEGLEYSNKLIIIRELGLLIKEMHALPTTGLEAIDCHWEQWIDQQLLHCMEQQRITKLPQRLLEGLSDYLHPIKERLTKAKETVLLTGEYTPMNLLVKRTNGIWHIHGLIDFGDVMLGVPEYDLLGPGAFLIQGDKQLLREFLLAYGYTKNELTSVLSHHLMALMLLHRYSNLSVQIRIKDWQNKVNNIKDLEQLVWGFDNKAVAVRL